MSEAGVINRVSVVRFERLWPATPERVWQILTDSAQLPGWFGDGVIEPRVGGAVRLMGGHVRGTVTQWLPPKSITYSWNVFGPGEIVSPYPESYLSLTLEPKGDAVRLTLQHLPVLERFEKQNAMGWHTFLDMAEAALRGAPPEPREIHMKRNAALYGVDLGNLAR